MYKFLRIIYMAHKFSSWSVGHGVQDIQEFSGCLKALQLRQFDNLIFYSHRLFTVEIETLHGVDEHLSYRHEQSLVHDLEIEQAV